MPRLHGRYYNFSNTIEQHFSDLTQIIIILQTGNMKISPEKSKFFKLETSFLGYIVSFNVIKTEPEKICTISIRYHKILENFEVF